MAENINETTETKSEQTEVTEPGGKNHAEETTPTVEELMAQLASERAEKEKYKNASDKASSEASKYKKQLRSKQTAEEQEAAAREEADRIQKENYENAMKELNHIKAVAAYKNISEKAVDTLIEAVSDGDHGAIAKIIENEVKAAVASAKSEWMKTRPAVNTGQSGSMTKEQIMAIQDRDERLRAIAANRNLF